MQTSHIVFINDRPLVFSYVYSKQLPVEYTGYAILNDESSTIDKAIKLLESGKEIGVVYFSESPDESWKRFISKYTS